MTPATPSTAGRIHTSRAATILELREGAAEIEVCGRASPFVGVLHERKTPSMFHRLTIREPTD